jgi:hypothetical protein
MRNIVKHRFVQFVPDLLEEGVIYVSVEYATAVHKCCCGCGKEVVTPLAPTDWQLTFDGQSISLYPSIGNWSFPCRSHYWIERNRVRSAPQWSKREIASGRAADARAKRRFYTQEGKLPPTSSDPHGKKH